MTAYDPKRKELRDWLEGCFPKLNDRIPLNPIFSKFGNTEMLSSYDHPSLNEWLTSSGFPKFIKNPDLPDGYFTCGIKSPAVSESLIVMWKDNDRYFWLYDQYAMYITENSGLSVTLTQKNLDFAFVKWNEGKQHVIFLMGKFHEWDPDFW